MSIVSKTAPFHRRLHQWYAHSGRKELPWRNTCDPYAIYISEIMLQQTQVKTVLERYYFPFLQRFPTLSNLAKAEPKQVLKAWQGLGYYQRAANLHKAAKQCGGKMPNTVESLMELPGIGRNTAHAVAAFAFKQPVPVMEANVKRVISRIFALTQPSTDELWEKADALLDKHNPFDYNQAMMDIGALICLPRAPKCGECPAAGLCQGKANPLAYPAKKSKKIIPTRKRRIIVLKNAEGKYFATPRKTRFLNGLYHFLETNLESGTWNLENSRFQTQDSLYLGHIRQQYSHFTLEAEVYLKPVRKRGESWYSLAQLKRLPMSMAEHKIVALLK